MQEYTGLIKTWQLHTVGFHKQVFTGIITKDIKGRFVIVEVGMREYKGKMYSQMNKLSYSKANDKLPPIPEAKSEQGSTADMEDEVDDIDSEKIPF